MRMTKKRQAMFAKYPWCDADRAKKLHKQMTDDYDKILALYKNPVIGGCKFAFTDDKDHNGNLIIENFLQSNSPEAQQARLEKHANRQRTRDRLFNEFREVFGVSLRDYWINAMIGFDVVKFDNVIQPNDDESTAMAVERKYGKRALTMVRELLA